ncbi:latrophilin-like protein 1 [Limulus polyphemus]|uniref:Latrophilin-like protein 1 n=1 Tax=Limulus polyphemus TaxID=6850 RepID=A0ABM1BAQ9_LIMPO|nr:latrophilin-like protein 1 [Limulus polyphemus]
MTGCVVCLLAVILTFGTTPFYFRNERPGLPTVIVNILIAVAANQIIILFGITATDDEVVCSSVALLLHYVHLVGSLWLICYVVHIYRQLWQLSERPWTILGYCLVSWLLPAGFVVSSYLINPKGYETNQYCWLTIQGGMGISFVLPMVFLLLLNTVFILASMKRFFALRSVTPKNEIDRIRFSLRTGMVILPYFFVNWFFSVLAFEDVFTTMFHYIFALTNSLQGILIFLFFCALNPKLQRACRETIRRRGKIRRMSSVRMKRSSFSTRHERESCRYNDSYPLLPDSSNEIHSIL